jgi:hypothetical protein
MDHPFDAAPDDRIALTITGGGDPRRSGHRKAESTEVDGD